VVFHYPCRRFSRQPRPGELLHFIPSAPVSADRQIRSSRRTNSIHRAWRIFFNGFVVNSTMSASLPGSMQPSRCSRPSGLALFKVLGHAESLAAEATRRGVQWLQGVSHRRAAFS